MKTSYIFLSDGFEEIEALSVVDILRRAEISIITLSMNDTLTVKSSHGVTVVADALFRGSDLSDGDYLILPGGSTKLNEYDDLKLLLRSHADRGGRIAAICAAPMVLGGISLLDGKRATCYPGFEKYLVGATFVDEGVVVDGAIITANGPASSLKFAYTIVEQIVGAEVAATIRQQMIY
ncbi:MAG: DJ-1 family glyoxalase III [Rikenellaceae bacterium]